MNKSKKIRAIILSAFVFPGLGQYHAGARKRGIALIILTLLLILGIFISTLSYLFGMIEQDIIEGELMPGELQLSAAIAYARQKAPLYSEYIWKMTKIPVLMLVLLWGYSIADLAFSKKYKGFVME